MSCWCMRACAWVVALAGWTAAYAQPRERDVWHALVHEGQRYGYAHTTVTKLPNGNFRYAVETRVLIDLLGVNPQEYTQQAEYVVTPRYRPISFQSAGQQASGAVRASGSAKDEQLVVQYVRAGIDKTAVISLSDGVMFKVCLDDWLNEQPAPVQAAEINVIDEEAWRLQPGSLQRARRDATGSVWSFNLGVDGGKGTAFYDTAGLMLETRMAVPKLHVQRCTPEEVRDITHRVLAGRDVLMFPIEKDFGNPQRLTSLTVKLTWRGIPFDQFQLEDGRQRIVSKSENNDQYEVVLRIGPAEPARQTTSYPVEDKQFAPYLTEERYIKPQDTRIVATAREVVAGQATAIEAVEALSAWVSKYIQGAMIAETLSGPEILACKQGKCSEYAILFASLARAVGIPTRIVLGDRIAGGNWIGHMWNEAYVGRWVTVDASANQVGTSFELLKFTHSDTVMGTQVLRWALTDSLSIEVADWQARPSPLADKYKTGVEAGPDGNVYTNVDYACRLTTPSRSWAVEDKPAPGALTVRFRIPNEDDVLVHFVAFAAPPGIEPKSFIDARLNLFRKYEDFAALKNEPCEVRGTRAHTLRFSRSERRAGEDRARRMLTTEVVWVRGSSGYLLNLIAEESAHDKYLADFEKLLASFEHLDGQ